VSIEEQDNIMDTFFQKDIVNVKLHFRYAKCWKCCGGERCIGNRKVAGRRGLIHNNSKTKTKK